MSMDASPKPIPPLPESPFMSWLRGMIKGYKTDNSLRTALDDYIQATPAEGTADITHHERLMLSNVLKMRDMRVVDVMIPRADIVAVSIDISREEFFTLLGERQFSRYPVFRQTLDDVVGTIHIKDIMSYMAQDKPFVIRDLIREVPVVAPSLPIADLIIEMRENKKHMVMVVDEYGGIDGIVTIGDVIETIFGELADEHEQPEDALIERQPDGTIIIDARMMLSDFEVRFNAEFTPEEKEQNDTIAGLVTMLSGHVPARGEIIRHGTTRMKFEVIDADPRRVYRVRVKNLDLVASPSMKATS
jgi:magnesium and cobalt transporter